MDSGVAQLLAVGGLVAVVYLVMSSRQPSSGDVAPSARQAAQASAVESYATPQTAKERKRERRRERAGTALEFVGIAAQLGSALVERR